MAADLESRVTLVAPMTISKLELSLTASTRKGSNNFSSMRDSFYCEMSFSMVST